MARKVQFVETVLRDANQSLIATRMTTEQMLPIIDKMDKVMIKEFKTTFDLIAKNFEETFKELFQGGDEHPIQYDQVPSS